MIKKTIERQTLNGTQWQIVVSQYGVTLFMNEKYSGYSFSTVADAQTFLDAVDERVKATVSFAPCDVPADYYGVRGRYYGD